jgi:hypothetical protein
MVMMIWNNCPMAHQNILVFKEALELSLCEVMLQNMRKTSSNYTVLEWSCLMRSSSAWAAQMLHLQMQRANQAVPLRHSGKTLMYINITVYQENAGNINKNQKQVQIVVELARLKAIDFGAHRILVRIFDRRQQNCG